MKYLQTARVAMVALTAIGMIWTSTAHAAPTDSSKTIVYGNNPPTAPGTPTVPGYNGPGLAQKADIKITYTGTLHSDYGAQGGRWYVEFTVENLGPGTAGSVKVHTEIARVQEESVAGPIYPLGAMGSGAKKKVLVECWDKPGQQPCLMIWAEAWTSDYPAQRYAHDPNPGNNRAQSYGLN